MKEQIRAREYAQTINVLSKGAFDPLLATATSVVEQLAKSPALSAFFDHPSIPVGEKLAMIDKMAQVNDGLLAHILHKLVSRNDVGLLRSITTELEAVRKKNENRLDAMIHSACALTDAQKKAVDKRLSEITGKTILARHEIDPSLVGGLRIRIGDRIIDNTVRTRMESLSDQLFIASLQ